MAPPPRKCSQHAALPSTVQLLTAIVRLGTSWPEALVGFSLEAVSEAVRREIAAGLLQDGRTLTARGAEVLKNSLSSARQDDQHDAVVPATSPRMELVFDLDGCWTVICPACSEVFGGGTISSDESATDAAVATALAHACAGPDRVRSMGSI